MATTEIAINIKGNTADISKKLDQVNAHLSNLGNKATGARTKMTGLGNSFTGIMGKASALSAGFLGIAAAIRAVTGTINTMANFGFEMSKVEAISGATGNTLKEMTSLAREMGATTMFTATEAAQGLKFLSMAGFNAEEAMKALPATLDLAQAGTIDLARAADISSNIMSAFGVDASKTTGVINDMVTTVNNANTDVQQLGDAMKYVGAAAAAAGIPIPNVASAIGVLSNAGMQGAMAGTGLRQVFIRLTNVTGAAEEALLGMGLTLDKVNPQSVGLTTAITRLREAGMTGAEAITIFGARGAVAALNLAKGLPKYHELRDLMAENEGIASKTSRTMEGNLLGSFKLLKSAVQEAVLSFGDKGMKGSLDRFIKTMTEVVRVLAGTGDPLSEFHMKAQMIVVQINKVVKIGTVFFKVWLASKIFRITAAIGGMAIALGKMAVVVKAAVVGAFAAATAGANAFKLALVRTGVGALVVGLGYLIASLMSVDDKAKAAEASMARLAQIRAEDLNKQLTFEYDEIRESEDGGNIKGRIDTKDLPDLDDMTSMGELGNALATAKKIRKENTEGLKDIERLNFFLSGGTDVFDNEGYERIAKLTGMENTDLPLGKFAEAAFLKIYDEHKRSAEQILVYQSESTKKAVAANVAAKKHNELIQERLAFLKQIAEENARAITSEDNRSGKIALLESQKKRSDTELNELENKGELNAQEQRRLNLLKEQQGVLNTQLAHERGMLFAERAGSKALEESLKLRKQLTDAQAEQADLQERQKERFVDPSAFLGGEQFSTEQNTALDLVNQLDMLSKKAKEFSDVAKGEPLIGAKGFDMYGQAESLLGEIKRFGEGGDFNLNEEQADIMDGLYNKLFDVLDVSQKAKKAIEDTGDIGAYVNRPIRSVQVGDQIFDERDLLNAMVDVGNSVNSIMEQPGIDASQALLDRAKEKFAEAGPEMAETISNAINIDKRTGAESLNLEGFNQLKKKTEDNNRSMADQLIDSAAKITGINSEQLYQQNLIALARQKELNAINKILTADNRSLDMQKRKLRLIGGKASGRQIAEIEGREQVADHMVNYEGALRKKMQMQLAAREGGPERPGDLTEEEIKRKLQEEKGIAANVIAQELAKKSSEKAGFGVSTLAKIGGGGGVGGGGDPMLNAAELANKLMNQAQEVRKQGVKKQNELVEEQKRTTVAIKNMGRVDQFTVIPA